MKKAQGLLVSSGLVLCAALALSACGSDECATGDCGVGATAGAGGVGGLGAGGGNLTGDEPGQACVLPTGECDWKPFTTGLDAAALTEVCTQQSGTVATDCPRQALSGCCANHNGIECHYNAADLQALMTQCEGQRGTWRTTPP